MQWWLMHTRQGLTVNIISDAVYLVYGTIFILSHAVLPSFRNLLWDVYGLSALKLRLNIIFGYI